MMLGHYHADKWNNWILLTVDLTRQLEHEAKAIVHGFVTSLAVQIWVLII